MLISAYQKWNRQHYLENKIKEICSTTVVSGTEIQIEGSINRPPMEFNRQSEKLLNIIQDVGEEMGLKVKIQQLAAVEMLHLHPQLE